MPPRKSSPIVAIADTNIVIWYLNDWSRLSRRAQSFLNSTTETNDAKIGIATITLVELVYLIDRVKFPVSVLNSLTGVLRGKNALFTLVPLSAKIAYSVARVARDDVPDMPDRIISATALMLRVPVITADERILRSSVETIW